MTPRDRCDRLQQILLEDKDMGCKRDPESPRSTKGNHERNREDVEHQRNQISNKLRPLKRIESDRLHATRRSTSFGDNDISAKNLARENPQ